jgi:hypothetical protein
MSSNGALANHVASQLGAVPDAVPPMGPNS